MKARTMPPLFRHTVFMCLLSLLLTACGQDGGVGQHRGSSLLANLTGRASSSSHGTAIDDFRQALGHDNGTRRRLGTDEFIGDGRGSQDLVEVSDTGEYVLNLVDVPIDQAARAVLGEALRKNYTIQPGVNGTVTLQTTRAMSAADLLETFQIALELNDATLQRSGNGLITIVPLSGATRRVSIFSERLGAGARVVAIPLEYVGTAEMVRLLQPIAGSSVQLSPIPNRNTLLVAGTRSEINATIEAVNLFDVDVLKGKSVGLFPLRAAEADAVVTELNTIFESGEGGSLQNVVTFVPSQRLGAILVISSRQKYLAEAERWIRDLDRTAGGSRRRPVVYSLQNRSALELEPILQGMLEDVSAEAGANVEGRAKVAADDGKNAIVVWGNDIEQESFARLIQTLDTTPVQVLLEATIAEVTLNDELNFGLRWFFEKGRFGGKFTDASSGSTGANFPGLSFMFAGNSAGATLNALNSITQVNVISTPSLMVMDNQEGVLQIGDQVPIATQQVRDTTNPNAPVVNTISFRDTGILLTVKPRVSSSGQVVLDIEQEVSAVQKTTTSGIDSPTISQRRIKTSVVITDGNTLALGGLIEEGRNRNNAQVPGVGDVPVLGALFRNRTDQIGRTELLVLITPRVIRNGNEARAVTAELRKRIMSAQSLVADGITDPGVGHRILD